MEQQQEEEEEAAHCGQDFAVLADGALVEGPGRGALAVDGAAGDGEPVHPPELDPVVAEPLQVRRGLERPLQRRPSASPSIQCQSDQVVNQAAD